MINFHLGASDIKILTANIDIEGETVFPIPRYFAANQRQLAETEWKKNR